MSKNPINKFLLINRFGQLIRIRDKPEIIDGWQCNAEGHSLLFLRTMETLWYMFMDFTIAQNQFKGL